MDCASIHLMYCARGTGAGPTYWLASSASLARSRPAPAEVEQVARAVRAGGPSDLDKPALLQGKQFFVDQYEWEPQEFREIVSRTSALNVEHLQNEVTHRVSRQASVGQCVGRGRRRVASGLT